MDFVYHSTLGLRVIKKKKRGSSVGCTISMVRRLISSEFAWMICSCNPTSTFSTATIFAESPPLLHRNVKRFRGGLAFKAHRLLYQSTLGLRVIKKKKTCSAMNFSVVAMSVGMVTRHN